MAKKAGAGSSHKPGFAAYILGALLIAILISFSGIFNYAVTGLVTATASSRANVTITGYIAIAMSDNLTQGIWFGDITLLPANNTNATFNYVNSTGGQSSTGAPHTNLTMYNVTVSSDSNQGADFCIKANTDLATDGGASRIGLGNMSSQNNKYNNRTDPFGYANATSINTTYHKGFWTNIAVGQAYFYRFWLNVSGGQAAGDYNNTVSFRATTTGNACGS